MRLCKPRKTLARRQDSDLPFLPEDRIGCQALLLDTCVYIDLMQGRTPDLLDALIATRQANHSSVAAQELMHTVGVLDPNDDRSPTVIDPIRTIVLSMPTHRTFVPDADVLGRAALLSGIIAVCKASRRSQAPRFAGLRAVSAGSSRFGFDVWR
jgi:hypothetical protein